MMRRHLNTAVWVVGGQALTAIGTLLGVRLLTQFLPPEQYGTVTLLLGAGTLALNCAAMPLTQAAMHFYPTFAARAALPALYAAALRCYRRMMLWGLPLLVLAVLIWAVFGKFDGFGGGSGHGSLILLLPAALLICDAWRSLHLSLLNAARRHERYALWMAGDAWARPVLASAALVVLQRYAGVPPAAATVLAAYVLAAVCLFAIFARGSLGVQPAVAPVALDTGPDRALDKQLWLYALPLLPIGLIGWVNSLGDRYLIGAVLGLDEVGLYAAAYGLSSAPFMIVGGTMEQALRPLYQEAVSHGQTLRARRLFARWLSSVALVCGIGVLLVTLWHEVFAGWFLGAAYRAASSLMPWIALGYALRAVSYVFERVCYAYGKTRRVLVSQLSAAVAALIATPVGALGWGLRGAALAVPVYFAVQLLVAAWLAVKTRQEAGVTAPLVAAASTAS